METFFNTSPIIFLNKLGLLEKLLPALWENIYITDAVIEEINDTKITGHRFFKKYHTGNEIAVLAMPAALHKGETESIIGAIESDIKRLVIDDSMARKKAHSLGIKTMGTLGVLLLATKKNLISADDAVKFFYDLRKHSFWISEKLFTEIIEKLKTNNF